MRLPTIAALVLACVATTVAADDAAPSWTSFGRFQVVEGAAADAALRAQVQALVRSVNPSLRAAFEAQLLRSAGVYHELAIEAGEGGGVRIVVAGRTLEAPLDGTEVRQVGPEGHPVRIARRITDGALVQEIRTPQFRRIDTFRAEEDRGLVVESRFVSSLLPRPLEHTASYVRLAAE